MKNLKELTREELERFLLNEGFVGDLDLMNTMRSPKVFYTVMNDLQKTNGVKL